MSTRMRAGLEFPVAARRSGRHPSGRGDRRPPSLSKLIPVPAGDPQHPRARHTGPGTSDRASAGVPDGTCQPALIKVTSSLTHLPSVFIIS